MNFNDSGTLPSALWSRVLTLVWLDKEIVHSKCSIHREALHETMGSRLNLLKAHKV
jgi:hypothetical protein